MTNPTIMQACLECGVAPDDFFGSKRSRAMCNARRIAIAKLREAGLSYRAIARVIKRDRSTVQYWMIQDYRERRSRYYLRYNITKPEDVEGIELLQSLMAELRIGRKDLAKSKFKHCITARAIAIQRLGHLGLTFCHIGRLIGCDRATVRYWLKPGQRQLQTERRRARITRSSACDEQRAAA